ncbi:MAG: histidine kinase [Chitinispirillaceae bacterium]|nr:histidine kinase [Chitinispirillaceae bacterium]
MVMIRDSIGEPAINAHTRYFKDTGGVITLDSISSWSEQRWAECPFLPMNDGYSRSPVWVRLTIADSSEVDRKWYLSLSQPQLDTVELYRLTGKEATPLGSSGRLNDRAGQAIAAREPVFVLPARTGNDPAVFLLRIRTNDVCAISLRLIEGKEYLRERTFSSLGFGFYFGALAVIIFFNLFLFITVRFVSCLWYSLWILSLALFQASTTGHLLLVGFLPHWFILFSFAAGSIVFAAAFTASFLGLREFSPVLWRSMQLFGGLGALVMLSSPIGQGTPAAMGASILGGVFVIVCLVVGYASIRHRGRPAVFYACAITIFAFGILLTSVRNFGWLPNTLITAHGILISSVIEVTIIAIALIDRISIIEREKSQAREKAHLSEHLATESRLRALQAQINPHFLFNTLNTIAEMTSIDPEKAEKLVMRLSRLFRRTLSASVHKNVALSEELETIRTYLEIEKERFGNRLNYTIDVQGDPSAPFIVGQVLQPIVENAIKHGIEPLSRGGEVKVLCRIESEKIYIMIKDSGCGFGHSKIHEGTGYGFENVKERLHLAYGQAATITCSNDNGAVVEVSIPNMDGS